MKIPLIICAVLFLLVPTVHAAANLQVTAFSCSPAEIVLNDQFTCTATIQNTGDASGTLNTATLYPDSNNWLEQSTYAETVNTAIGSSATIQVVFNGLKGKKSGVNGFSKIMIDDVADTYVADSGTTVDVINIVAVAISSAASGTSGSAVDITAQGIAGGNIDTVLTFSASGTGCTIGSQPSSTTANEMTNGQTTSHTWTMTIGTANCSYSVSAQATSNPSGIASKTDSSSGSITCTNCVAEETPPPSGGGGGGGSGGGTSDSKSVIFGKVNAGEHAKMSGFPSSIPLDAMNVLLKNTASGFKITVEKLNVLPSGMSNASTKVYSYLNVSKNLSDTDVLNAVFKFRVEKTWLNNNSIGDDSIFLYRYTTQWDKLTTAKTNETNTTYYYEATSPGMSYFAIGYGPSETSEQVSVANASERVERGSEQPKPEEVTAPTEKPTSPAGKVYEAPGKPIEIPMEWATGIGVLIIILVLGWFYYHGHHHVRRALENRK